VILRVKNKVIESHRVNILRDISYFPIIWFKFHFKFCLLNF